MALPAEAPLALPPRGGPTDPSHDPELRRGILHTTVSRPLALTLVAGFLLVICGVPLAQAVMERIERDDSMLLELFRRAPTRQNLRRYEEDLEKASYLKEWVQPRLQLALSRAGAGNKRAVIGRDGWLFYQPGVMALAGPGLLDPEQQRVRRLAAVDAEEPALHPDPRPAVLELHRALAARGIRLVVFPVPDKATLQPAALHRRGGETVATNRDYPRLIDELRAAGVAVFDPAPARLQPGEPARYLVQDTHWTPTWMDQVARQLAVFVKAQVPLPPVPAPGWEIVTQNVERVGDIVDMLKLVEGQTLFAPQAVTVQEVRDAQGNAWAPQPSADVLLLGDSFTNVFSLEAMGWGQSAGLAPHLALALGRELDVIAQNDSGAFATRKLLSEALANGEDRLAGKRVVIWELAARELAVGNWRPFAYEVKR
jgi:hypothetical protein